MRRGDTEWCLCARRVLANQHRRARRDVALVSRLEAAAALRPAAIGITPGDTGLGEALAELGERDRELLLLIAWEGLEPAEAAKVLGCSRNALAVRLHRARKRLAAALARADFGVSDREARFSAKETLR